MKRSGAVALIVPLLVIAGLALAAGTMVVCAQDAAPYTLHAYANLVQVPALVLGENLKSIPSVKREQFAISLDHGPDFQPTQMRMEGDDPISLAVLLDARGDQDDILSVFGQALAGLVGKYLHPADHVSIYAIDCALNETADQVPADAAALKAGVAAALASAGLHGAQQRGACGSSIRLWDAVAKVAGTLGKHPGRRVLLVVSKGTDGQSTSGFAETVHAAESRSVAIFGLRYMEYVDNTPIKFSGNTLTYHPGQVSTVTSTVTVSSGGDPDFFDQMCEGTGGLVLNLWNPGLINPPAAEVTPRLEKMVTLLRGRYILEFPRPDAFAPGRHSIAVSVPQTHNLVLTTGVPFLSADPALLSDPTTVRSDPSPAELGPRHPLEITR
jgi:hypothetical protein